MLRDSGVKVAVNSGFGPKIIEVIVERLNWGKVVGAPLADDGVPRGRPHPDMIRKLMEPFGITSSYQVAR